MEVRALTRNVRISPEKARHVSRLIQGKSAVEALAIVELSPRKAASLLGDTLRSAVANAENNENVSRKALVVKTSRSASSSRKSSPRRRSPGFRSSVSPTVSA